MSAPRRKLRSASPTASALQRSGPFGSRSHRYRPATPPAAPPTISGTPPANVVAGQAYSFAPSASDPGGNALTFSIVNRPSWATFSTTTGQLTGTPTAANVGSYANITISVSDGTLTARCPHSRSRCLHPSPTRRRRSTAIQRHRSMQALHTASRPAPATPTANALTFSIQNSAVLGEL